MRKTLLFSTAICLLFSSFASADTFGTGDNQFWIEFVTIGNLNNPDSIFGYGSVDYYYRIGMYEITAGQYTAFLNETASLDIYSLHPGGSQIVQYGSSGNYNYVTSANQRNKPVHSIKWFDAARFCNYLTTGNTETGVYEFSSKYSYTINTILKHGDNPAYWIPTEGEWYKAAYYTGSRYSRYANGMDTVPTADNGWNYIGGNYDTPWDVGTGTEEQNGTFDMMGNVKEWNERESILAVYKGGSYADSNIGGNVSGGLRSNMGSLHLGFRIASNIVPEPTLIISIDIKHTSCPNPVNIKSKGVLPVAVLGSDVLDVNEIDPNSVEIFGVQSVRYSYEDVSAPADVNALPEECLCSTDGPDGYVDMVLKFDTPEIAEAIGEVEDGDYVILTLTGFLKDGTPIEGTDCVMIIKKGKH